MALGAHRTLTRRLPSILAPFSAAFLKTPPSSPPAKPMEKPHLAVLSSLLSQTLVLLLLLLHRRRPSKRRRLLHPPQNSAPAPAPPPLLTLALRPSTSPDPAINPFNMTSPTFSHLLSLLDPLLDARDPFPIPLTAPARLALALSRLATAAPYPALALHFSVPVPTAKFLTRHLCRVLCTNFRFWLAFPPSPAPGCLGALARSRFGPVSAQLAASPSSQIISIAAGFRAASTDSTLLKSTSLYKNSGALFRPSQYLAGCGDYPLLPWLMVPYGDPAGSDEEGFNEAHRRMCRPVLRAAASLRKWGALGRLEEEEGEDGKMAAALIGTCAILHNVLLMREDYTALSDAAEECEAWKGVEGGTEEAVAARRNLAARVRAVRESGQSGCSL